MASKTCSALAIFLTLNLISFSLVKACGDNCLPPNPSPNSNPNSYLSSSLDGGKCPRDVLKLALCTNVLDWLLKLKLGQPPIAPCCSLFGGLVDLEAAVCLCTALKLDILGIQLNIPLSLSLLLNVCSKKVPEGFQCA